MCHLTDTYALLFFKLYLKVKFQGLTGEVQFNLVTGERRAHNGLDIVNVLGHNVEKVCTGMIGKIVTTAADQSLQYLITSANHSKLQGCNFPARQCKVMKLRSTR